MTEKLHVIDGISYREVERKAKVGEKVIIVDAHCTGYTYDNGDILTVSRVHSDEGAVICDDVACYGNYDGQVDCGEYRVLEPVASPQSPDDIIANLVRRVAQLENQLDDALKNVHTFGEQTEANSADIRTLDERTQPLVTLGSLFAGGDRQ